MMLKLTTAALALLVAGLAAPAMAYVGPGAGLTLLSALWGLVAAVFLAIAFVVMWPVKRWLKRRQGADADDPTPTAHRSEPPGWSDD